MNQFIKNKCQGKSITHSGCFTPFVTFIFLLLMVFAGGCSLKTSPVAKILPEEPPDEAYTHVLRYQFETESGKYQFPVEYRITSKGKSNLFKAVFLTSLLENKDRVIHPDSIKFVKKYAPFFDPDGNLKITDTEARHFLKRVQKEYSQLGNNKIPVAGEKVKTMDYVLRGE